MNEDGKTLADQSDKTSWTKRQVAGYFNAMAVCGKCDRDATQTRISRYCVDLLARGPYLCDECYIEFKAAK